jgi:hypothetical protein
MTVVIEPDDRKTYLEKRILYHLTAYKKLPPSFIRAGIRVMLIKMMTTHGLKTTEMKHMNVRTNAE